MLDPRTALALALACSTLACQDQDAEALDRAIDDFAERFQTSRDLLCACPEQLGFASADECEAASGEIDGAAQECIADAFAGREGDGAEYLECVVELQDAYAECLYGVGGCAVDWYVTCQDQYEADVAAECAGDPGALEGCLPQ